MAFEGLSEKLNGVFKRLRGKGRLTEADVREGMREVRLALLEADVSYKVVKDFVADVTEKCIGTDVLDSLTPAQQIIKIVNQELTALMGGTNARLTTASKSPTVVMMVGLQGAGKTTNGAKLAGLMRRSYGKRPLLVACDVYRPAAINQLQVVGKQLDIPVFEMGQIDPVTIAKEAVKYAADHGHDIVFLDTAGRLHIDEALMDELKAVKAAVKPNEILLVVDAMTGQDAVNAAKAFDDALGIDGVLLTKLDGDARGGAALSIRAVTGKPIKFVGTGEKLDMIEPFHPDRMAGRILGMGAHAGNNNYDSIGVCFEGSFDREEMPAAQKQAGMELVAYLKQKYGISTVQRHSDVNATGCPGGHFPFEELAGAQASAPAAPAARAGGTAVTLPLLAQGSRSETVRLAQAALTGLGYDAGGADGIFGANTAAAVKRFQAAHGLAADGIVGRDTWHALLGV